jgi:isopenicillin N synthase-like dioxygenase
MSTTTLKTRFGEIEVAKDIVQGDFDTIPVIDLANMKHPDLAERKKVASEIYNACARVGFFYIKVISHVQSPKLYNQPTIKQNHGISEESVTKIHDAAHKYFALPLEKKMESFMGQSKV